jgi:hypothetical protein
MNEPWDGISTEVWLETARETVKLWEELFPEQGRAPEPRVEIRDADPDYVVRCGQCGGVVDVQAKRCTQCGRS